MAIVFANVVFDALRGTGIIWYMTEYVQRSFVLQTRMLRLIYKSPNKIVIKQFEISPFCTKFETIHNWALCKEDTTNSVFREGRLPLLDDLSYLNIILKISDLRRLMSKKKGINHQIAPPHHPWKIGRNRHWVIVMVILFVNVLFFWNSNTLQTLEESMTEPFVERKLKNRRKVLNNNTQKRSPINYFVLYFFFNIYFLLLSFFLHTFLAA